MRAVEVLPHVAWRLLWFALEVLIDIPEIEKRTRDDGLRLAKLHLIALCDEGVNVLVSAVWRRQPTCP